ncbi:cation:proton antiporter [Aspergillus vadensis CBS 113365]|uniref:Sodium/hydrogen exchanger n=1 Tax=Aspergillus vadensis (strain CBS 113365 / IMI 142717 / IBT 24658) TaxID=1448311 RepID=A0A319B0K7_ASPVC|nr:Sodium/hydrogen exchanger [Aspergillus vadensis CBS 113365]PYH63690.1 Sodium/hydrogen exchanger [Aspergillus vadensis CBS 113365]
MAGSFFPYHEPGIVQILIIISFFFILSLSEWASAKIIRAGIIGQIAVGIVYGKPLADILEDDWETTFLALGYVGLILIIFEGGLSARIDLLKANLVPSMLGAATGVCFPIGLSYLLLYLGFGYGAVETFIIGAALSATSLGTTFAVISSASGTVDLAQTRVGSVLISAAVIDDVVGLVMASVIGKLGQLEGGNDVNLGWLIGRPIVASIAMATATPIVTKFFFAPIFRRYIEDYFARYDHISNIILMILSLSAFISIAAYTGTSVLFGAFLAGTFLTYIPSKHPEGPFVVMSREEGERFADKSPTFVHTFERYLMDIQKYLMEPLFFASIGFAIPFVQLWTGKRIWRGVIFTLLMVFGKLIVGVWLPLWTWCPFNSLFRRIKVCSPRKSSAGGEVHTTQGSEEKRRKPGTIWLSAMLLGSAMVARGEIGLLIVEIGYNETAYVSEDGFITAVWAILLNTILGPATVGILVKFYGKRIGNGEWGLQDSVAPGEGSHISSQVVSSA